MHIGSAHTIRDSIKHVLKTDGPRGFYKGFGVHALNTFISQVAKVLWFCTIHCSGHLRLSAFLVSFTLLSSSTDGQKP